LNQTRHRSVEQAPLVRRQSAKLRSDKRLQGVVRLDGRLDQRPTVPARVVARLMRVGDRDEPILAGPFDSKIAVRAAAEPMV
jgi:hypothetical protein